MFLSFNRVLHGALRSAAGNGRRPAARRIALLGGAGLLGLAISTAAWSLTPVTAASASLASSSAMAHPDSYVVRAGAKLDDIAAEISPSSDKATRDRVATELFEANPRAFMGDRRDRLRVGAVLHIPAAVYAPLAASAPAAASAPFASLEAILAAFNNPSSSSGEIITDPQ